MKNREEIRDDKMKTKTEFGFYYKTGKMYTSDAFYNTIAVKSNTT